jgi:predicted dehydrogenase
MSKSISRRGFLKTGAAASAALTAAQYVKAVGANDRVRIGIIGPGGRTAGYADDKSGGHLSHLTRFGKDWNVEVTAVCDVWDYRTERAAGLAAKEAGFKAVQYKRDYRRLLEDGNVDAVCIGTPDHWHAKQAVDSMAAGKHVYMEKPMTRTVEEAQAVVSAWKRTGKVVQVGVQSMSDPRWRMACELIRSGRIGHVLQGQTHYYRNSSVGQWRYYALRKDMTPSSIDWKMFLGTDFGLAPEMPFDRAVFAQWRCYWPFGGGMYTDLFVHQTTHLIAAMGVGYPRRVVGGGGLYMEYDGRDVPDVATVVADYDEGCQVLVTASMCNNHAIEECIRGHTGTILFSNKAKTFDVIPQVVRNRPGTANAQINDLRGETVDAKIPPGDETPAHWKNFIDCVRANKTETNNTPELGAAAVTTVLLGTRSYREGKVFFWDKDKRTASDVDPGWAKGWEQRSRARGKPNQIQGWTADPMEGSRLFPEAYQKLEGPWIDGKDPADGVALGN